MTVCLVVLLSEGSGCHHILTRACHALVYAATVNLDLTLHDMFVSKQVSTVLLCKAGLALHCRAPESRPQVETASTQTCLLTGKQMER